MTTLKRNYLKKDNSEKIKSKNDDAGKETSSKNNSGWCKAAKERIWKGNLKKDNRDQEHKKQIKQIGKGNT